MRSIWDYLIGIGAMFALALFICVIVGFIILQIEIRIRERGKNRKTRRKKDDEWEDI